MTTLAAAELFVVALVALCLVSSLVWSLLAGPMLNALESWEPTRRHTVAMMLACAPAISAALLALSAVAPSLLALAVPALDHCVAHDDGHAHLCFRHLPRHAPHALLWIIVASLTTWLAAHVLMHVADLVRAHRRLRGLLRTATLDDSGTVLLEGGFPFCAAVGLLVPRVMVSSGLLDELTSVQRQALLTHETAHVRRRDALSRLTGSALSSLYPCAIRRRIMEALELAAEQVCDEAAGGAVGDRMVVAETILQVERTVAGRAHTVLSTCSIGMHDSNIERRIESLVAEPATRGSLRVVWLAVALSIVALAVGADSIHHAVESSLSSVLS